MGSRMRCSLSRLSMPAVRLEERGRGAVRGGSGEEVAVDALFERRTQKNLQGVLKARCAGEVVRVAHLEARDGVGDGGAVVDAGEVVAGVGAAEADVEGARHLGLDVPAEGIQGVLVRGLHAGVVLDAPADVVAEPLAPAVDADVVVLEVPVLEELVGDEVALTEIGALGVVYGVVLGLAEGEAGVVEELRHGRVEALLGPERDGRLADGAALGEDLDDAVGGVGAVEGRGGPAPRHLHALDVVREQLGQRRGRLAPAADRGARGVVDADAVDVDDGRLAAEDARDAAEVDEGALARLRALHPHRRSGHAPLQELIDRDHRRLLDVAGVEDGDVGGELPPLDRAPRPRHDELVEHEQVLAEGEVLRRRLAGPDRHGRLLVAVADEAGDDLVRPRRDAGDDVGAVDVGGGPLREPLDDDVHAGERVARGGVRYQARQRAGGLRRCRRGDEGAGEQEEQEGGVEAGGHGRARAGSLGVGGRRRNYGPRKRSCKRSLRSCGAFSRLAMEKGRPLFFR